MKPWTAIWFGIFLAIAAAATPSPLQAQVETPPPTVVKPPAALTPDVAFGRFVALIRGHLLTGEELVGQRQWDAARPHFSFPTEEIYGVIREDLRRYQTPPFDGALKVLARAVKTHSVKQYPMALRKVENALAAADAGLKARQPNWPRFVVIVAVETLKTAPDEYDDALAKGPNFGRIVRPIGYQTARGFILQADRMFESVAGEFAGNNATALSDIRTGFAQLKQAFGGVTAPKIAAVDSAVVAETVARIEAAAGRLM